MRSMIPTALAFAAAVSLLTISSGDATARGKYDQRQYARDYGEEQEEGEKRKAKKKKKDKKKKKKKGKKKTNSSDEPNVGDDDSVPPPSVDRGRQRQRGR
jgi:hypothetical protein